MMDPKPNTTRGLVGWALFDWANSPFTTLIVTFVFSVYFSLGIVGDEIRATQLWGNAVSISALIIAVMAPILGAIADAGGPRKPWLLGFTALCVLGSAMLWGAGPEERFIAWALIWFVIANVGFEFGVVFTNAMLPDLVPHSRLGRWSGWAWGLGYFGGLAAIIVALVAFVQADQPLFGLDKDTQEHVRVVGPLAAAWLAVFAIPLFLWTPDRPRTGTPLGQQISGGLRSLSRTLGQLRAQANTVRFLIARMIYTDGLITVFAMGDFRHRPECNRGDRRRRVRLDRRPHRRQANAVNIGGGIVDHRRGCRVRTHRHLVLGIWVSFGDIRRPRPSRQPIDDGPIVTAGSKHRIFWHLRPDRQSHGVLGSRSGGVNHGGDRKPAPGIIRNPGILCGGRIAVADRARKPGDGHGLGLLLTFRYL